MTEMTNVEFREMLRDELLVAISECAGEIARRMRPGSCADLLIRVDPKEEP